MIPYSGLYFFYLIFLLLIPAIILGLMGKSLKIYGMIVNLIVLIVIFQGSKKQTICLIAFYLGELILVKLYLLLTKKTKKRWTLWITIIMSILPLILVKWGDILIHRTVGFLGVSYLTFKVVQVIIEIYDGLITEVNFLEFTYFLLYFPTISSGPIDRSKRFNEDINKVLSRDEYIECLRAGIWRLFTGIGYKFILGSLISNYWMNKIPSAHTFANTINYMYAYSFYLFFDFAGYSLIAVGVSYVLGIKTPDNFNLPFLSKDIKDFWNRWHITLSFWFRDFIYTRFVMNAIRNKWFKSRYTASYIAYLITMITMGIWHGTEIYYILYGLYQGVLIVATDFFQRKSKLYKKYKNNEVWNIASTIITFNFVCFGFLIFSGRLFTK